MTITTLSTKAVAQGNNATTVWPYTFLIPELQDVILTLVDVASGNETIIAPVNFTITGLGSDVGGSVTYPLSGSPLTTATKIVIERFLPETQEIDLVNQGGVYPADIESGLDNVTMMVQQLQDQVDRSIVFSVADTIAPTLPLATARANKFLGFNASGDPVAVDGLTAGTTVSAAMIPVVTAPTTAAALTALGLPGALLDLLIPSGTEWAYNAGGAAPTGFVYPIGQPCTSLYPDYRAKLISAGSPYGTNGVDPLMPDKRSMVNAGKSNMGGVDNGLLTGGTVLGAVLGNQNKSLATNNLPAYTPSGTITNGAITNGAITFPNSNGSGGANGLSSNAISTSAAVSGGVNLTIALGPTQATTTQATSTLAGTAQGGTATAFSLVQPTFICNLILKVH